MNRDGSVMWFFTGKGDKGKTNLIDKANIAKNDPRLELIGAIDEINAHIGLAISVINQPTLRTDLKTVQELLSKVMGIIARVSSLPFSEPDLDTALEFVEEKILFYGREIDKPKNFTFPGKKTSGAALDICRTITRRAERQAVGMHQKTKVFSNKIIAFLNRLSSFFYILRLFCDKKE